MVNKTIAIIAANGRTGQALVTVALETGMRIRAGYHGKNTLPRHENIVAIRCDATNEAEVRQLLDGADVVVSLIGHVKDSPAKVQSDSIQTIVNVMNELNIKRIFSLTGTGVRFPGDTPNLLDKLLNTSIKIIDPERISDGIAHAQFLASTNLNWTIIRVLKLTNGKHSGRVTFSPSGPAELLTPRSRVAKAIVQLVESGEYVKKSPVITGSE